VLKADTKFSRDSLSDVSLSDKLMDVMILLC